jgi:hypothetical protein
LQQLGVRLLAINRRLASLEADPNSTSNDYEPVLGAQVDVVPKILAHTASTIDGLAVQVVACIAGCREIWESEEGDCALGTERPFIEAVARYAGVQHPVRNIKPWTPSADAYKPPPDPILAAIAKHREAYEGTVGRALADLADVEQRTDFKPEHPERQEADRKVDAAWRVEEVAFNELLNTAPTTAAGAKAALDWFHTLIEGGDNRLKQRTLQIYETLSTAIASA